MVKITFNAAREVWAKKTTVALDHSPICLINAFLFFISLIKMGQSGSTSRAIQLLQKLEGVKDKGSINDVRAFTLNSKTIILIGESHLQVAEGTTPPFVQFLRELECEERLDVFIEGSYGLKENFRYRESTPEKVEEATTPDLDSIGRVRLQAEVEKCGDKLRVHAIDVRDPGFMLLSSKDMTPDEVMAYTYTLRSTQLDYVMRIIIASSKKSDYPDEIKGFSKIVAKSILKDCDFIMDSAAAARTKEDILWKAYAKLVDMYTFSRMLKRDNSDLLILYAGSNHIRVVFEAFVQSFQSRIKVIMSKNYDQLIRS